MGEPVYYRLRLGLNIRMRRHVMKLTQAELAQRAGCTSAAISALERGKRETTVNLLYQLSCALECPISELLLGVE